MQLNTLLPESELDPKLGALEIEKVQLDSRQVEAGDAFFALPGTQLDGAKFAPKAAAQGAAAIIAAEDAEIEEPLSCPVIRVKDPARAVALAAAIAAGPQPRIMAGVTGTAGKSSVVHFLRQIWQFCGLEAASIGTIGITRSGGTDYGGLTTPDAVSLQNNLASLARDGVEAVALEASSHGIRQRRLDGVRFDAVAFTNLGRDHMDYHPTVEDYFAAKMRLFEILAPDKATAVIDADGTMSDEAIKVANARGLKLFTVGEKGKDLRLLRRERSAQGQTLTLLHKGIEATVNVPLMGDFQASNVLVAIGLTMATGCKAVDCFNAAEKLSGTPGRMEFIGSTKGGASVFVDYAHKPDALKAVLEALRPFTTSRLISLFGCGGDRDHGKRPLMGEISASLADITVVTDDNPRSEDPATIRAAIMAATPGALEIGDRREAIKHAIKMLEPGDILVIAGKGHEQGQIVGDDILPFSDQEEARAALAAQGDAA